MNAATDAVSSKTGALSKTWQGLSPTAKAVVAGAGGLAAAGGVAKLYNLLNRRDINISTAATPASQIFPGGYSNEVLPGSSPGPSGAASLASSTLAARGHQALVDEGSRFVDVPVGFFAHSAALGEAFFNRKRLDPVLYSGDVLAGGPDAIALLRQPSYYVHDDGSVSTNSLAYLAPLAGGNFWKNAGGVLKKGLSLAAKYAAPLLETGVIPGGALLAKGLKYADGLVKKVGAVTSSLGLPSVGGSNSRAQEASTPAAPPPEYAGRPVATSAAPALISRATVGDEARPVVGRSANPIELAQTPRKASPIEKRRYLRQAVLAKYGMGDPTSPGYHAVIFDDIAAERRRVQALPGVPVTPTLPYSGDVSSDFMKDLAMDLGATLAISAVIAGCTGGVGFVPVLAGGLTLAAAKAAGKAAIKQGLVAIVKSVGRAMTLKTPAIKNFIISASKSVARLLPSLKTMLFGTSIKGLAARGAVGAVAYFGIESLWANSKIRSRFEELIPQCVPPSLSRKAEEAMDDLPFARVGATPAQKTAVQVYALIALSTAHARHEKGMATKWDLEILKLEKDIDAIMTEASPEATKAAKTVFGQALAAMDPVSAAIMARGFVAEQKRVGKTVHAVVIRKVPKTSRVPVVVVPADEEDDVAIPGASPLSSGVSSSSTGAAPADEAATWEVISKLDDSMIGKIITLLDKRLPGDRLVAELTALGLSAGVVSYLVYKFFQVPDPSDPASQSWASRAGSVAREFWASMTGGLSSATRRFRL
jgi:hypothetical protein